MSTNTKQEMTVPPLVSASYLAEAFDVTTQTIRDWLKKGMPKAGHAKYPFQECCVWIKAHYQVIGAKQYKDGKSKHSRAEWDLRKAAAVTLEAELDLAVKRGTVVSIDAIQEEIESILEGFRTQLRSIPGLWAGDILGLENKPDAQDKLNILVDDLMMILSKPPDLPDFAELEKIEAKLAEEDE